MSPASEFGPPTPSPGSECTPPPEPKGGTLACGRGGGEAQIPATVEKA